MQSIRLAAATGGLGACATRKRPNRPSARPNERVPRARPWRGFQGGRTLAFSAAGSDNDTGDGVEWGGDGGGAAGLPQAGAGCGLAGCAAARDPAGARCAGGEAERNDPGCRAHRRVHAGEPFVRPLLRPYARRAWLQRPSSDAAGGRQPVWYQPRKDDPDALVLPFHLDTRPPARSVSAISTTTGTRRSYAINSGRIQPVAASTRPT